MRNERIRRAYDSVLPGAEAKERMLRSILSQASNAQPERNVVKMKKRNIKKAATIILAAALALALSAVALAYATDLFGFRALARPEPEGGYHEDFPISEGQAVLSLTQPQDVPEEVDAGFETDIAAKLETSRLAWDEWLESKAELTDEYDAVQEKFYPKEFEDVSRVDGTDNGDGTVTWEYKTHIDGEDVTLGTRVFTKEESQEYSDFMVNWMNYDSGYDFNYHVCSEAQKAKLEEIAEKYGLKLRGNCTSITSKETLGLTDDGYTNEDLVDIISDVACSGRLFNDTPSGWDKVYYFDEGTFAVVWIADLPDGRQAWCYGYNSMYGTLSSGNEVYMIADTTGFTERTHVTPDGTEVTILSNGGDEAYLYVYLENSFFAESIDGKGPIITGTDVLTDADLDYIADNINYSVIGK
ncbi:MAG: hypothetical protein NC489_40450 [Ruminococcus flavefaciens]|nr:hypothetical protein [Ruminococcus flavefaciens]